MIDPFAPGLMALGREAGDAAVFGVVAADPGVMLGASEPAGSADGEVSEVPVAVSGIVACKVDAAWGAIRAGDLLQTSPTPGHAMRSDDPRVGTVLGKALEPLDAGTGVIRVLVTLR